MTEDTMENRTTTLYGVARNGKLINPDELTEERHVADDRLTEVVWAMEKAALKPNVSLVQVTATTSYSDPEPVADDTDTDPDPDAEPTETDA